MHQCGCLRARFLKYVPCHKMPVAHECLNIIAHLGSLVGQQKLVMVF